MEEEDGTGMNLALLYSCPLGRRRLSGHHGSWERTRWMVGIGGISQHLAGAQIGAQIGAARAPLASHVHRHSSSIPSHSHPSDHPPGSAGWLIRYVRAWCPSQKIRRRLLLRPSSQNIPSCPSRSAFMRPATPRRPTTQNRPTMRSTSR